MEGRGKKGFKKLGDEKMKKGYLTMSIAILVISAALCSLASVASAATSLSCTGDPSHSCSSYDSVSSIDTVSTVAEANPGDAITVTVDWTGWHWGDSNHFGFFMKPTSGGSWEFIDSCSTFKSDSNIDNHYTMDCPITVPNDYSGDYYIKVTANDYGGYCNPGESGVDAEGSTTITILGDDDDDYSYSVLAVGDYVNLQNLDNGDADVIINNWPSGWTLDQNERDGSVQDWDFIDESYGADESDFLYYTGHGSSWCIFHTEVCLREWNWPFEDDHYGDFWYEEVYQDGYDNLDYDFEWAFFAACSIHKDEEWDTILKTKGHGTFGYDDVTFDITDNDVARDFVTYVKAGGQLEWAFVDASTNHGFNCYRYALHWANDDDHLWGEGVVYPDTTDNTDIYWWG